MVKKTLVMGKLKDVFREAEMFELDFKERGRFMINEKERDFLFALMKNHKLSIIMKNVVHTQKVQGVV